jgi:hypothetical protein
MRVQHPRTIRLLFRMLLGPGRLMVHQIVGAAAGAHASPYGGALVRVHVEDGVVVGFLLEVA